MKRILINATQKEELRVAMVNGQKLYDLDIEVPSREQKKSNIYKAKITRIEPSLEAVFVNYGAERHGFLPFKEISRKYIDETAKDDNGRLNIKDAIKVDQEVIVQVEKEERGNKGAALTTFISLAGRFLVAMPHNPKAGGVSRRIEGEDRDLVRKVLSELNMPSGMGVIVRTAGVGRSTEEMQWDLDSLVQVWEAIESAGNERKAPFLIYQESDIVVRALRDHYKSDVGEIIIDSKSFFERAHSFMEMVMPNALHKLKLFEDKLPLFNRFQIENQIETAFSREVNLPSGGAIVIDHTEALISIDVNSARATKGSDIEATAKNTNLEAADEIARQLRIRDLGGLVVIDFIDMLQNKNQREVEQRLRNAIHDDRARVQTTRISRFGLMEMSRQRLRPSLGESSQIVCPRCDGQGTIRDVESLSLAVLRLLEEEALKDNTGRILVKIPVDCATYLLNEKRTKIAELEDHHKVHAVIIPDPKLETPHFEIERVRENDTHRHESNYKNSYEMVSDDKQTSYNPLDEKKSHSVEKAAVQRVTTQPKPPAAPATTTPEAKKSEGGFITKLFASLFGANSDTKEQKQEEVKSNNRTKNTRTRRNNSNRNNRNKNNLNRNNRNRNNQDRNAVKQKPKANDSTVKETASAQANNEKKTEQNKQQNNDNKPRNNRSRNNRNRNQRKDKSENKPNNNKPEAQSKPSTGAENNQPVTPVNTKERKTASPQKPNKNKVDQEANSDIPKKDEANDAKSQNTQQGDKNKQKPTQQKLDSDATTAADVTHKKETRVRKTSPKPKQERTTSADTNKTQSSTPVDSKPASKKAEASTPAPSKTEITKSVDAKNESSKSDNAKPASSKTTVNPKSENTKTERPKSETAKPLTAKTEGSKSDNAKPTQSTSENSKTENAKPDNTHSENSKPEQSKPKNTKAESSQPVNQKPEKQSD